MDNQLILIIDDNGTNLKVLSQTLTSAGFQLAVATNGEEALEQVLEELPELILLDVKMPKIDGFETCIRLKANPKTKDIPIIFMTALSETIDKVKGLSLGAVDYITKPFDEQDVLARVRVHLRLRAAQKQIISQEKLASLGTITAGVAHELRNPLNFVINYAQSSLDSLNQLLANIQQNPTEDSQEILTQLQDIITDAEAIDEHGQRASRIIESMMQLARSEPGEYQCINLNDILDQAIKLAYHSFRVKHPQFVITIKTQFDPHLEVIEVIISDLHRALINIIDNSCYALYLKMQENMNREEKFDPTLCLITKNQDSEIEIKIHDNGIGIQPEFIDNIFTPFFTTKPPGQGIGLGLSLTHDIIVLQHGGTLQLDTQWKQYTELILKLPKNQKGN
ncbi:Response Regulator Receiver Signal Transduction Histidine Kinase [Planktothrix sp. PCC 11201]|uniref:hybrid sensor histidine kinase/response regulator n=1 Tax=Planktothrix sp. PCC 11201 TaxID=1729650 RepID=UPI00091925A4|nr:hybrid sensor histidine kinase/response regulator [Planktothrix sp. PCC 11201]SKB11995.1 Response Regulator Receiver Signal Transduction Histidine Kinase [Planktothrix sp. PCC 11201]